MTTTGEQRLYAIVLRLAATRRGAVPADHGNQARSALMNIIQHADSPLAQRLHDANSAKPYTISLLHGGRRGKSDGAQHFDEGDPADWRFTLLIEPAFEALLRRYLLDRALPHVRIGAVTFAIVDAFASGSHPDSGHRSVAELLDRWNCPPATLENVVTLDFRSPTTFSLGQDRVTGDYRFRATPDPKIVFSTLRKRWVQCGGIDPGDAFDTWVAQQVEAEPLSLLAQTVWIKKRSVPAFAGQVRFRVHGAERHWLPLLYLLGDLAFWTGVGYQTTGGLGQVRRL